MTSARPGPGFVQAWVLHGTVRVPKPGHCESVQALGECQTLGLDTVRVSEKNTTCWPALAVQQIATTPGVGK